MNIALWALQVVLAVAFAGAGAIKLVKTRDQLADKLGGWVHDVPAWLPKPLGAVEVLAAIGLVVPPLVHIAPLLTPLAASGLVLVMVGAIATHARRGERRDIVTNVVLLLLAAIVAWGRFGPYAL